MGKTVLTCRKGKASVYTVHGHRRLGPAKLRRLDFAERHGLVRVKKHTNKQPNEHAGQPTTNAASLEDAPQGAAVAVANTNASNANGPTSIPAFAPTGEPADDVAAVAPPSAEVLDDPVARCLVSLSQAFWGKHTGDEIGHVLQHVLFPLARHVETPESVCWLFRVIRSMTFGFEAIDQSRKDAFATDKVRDEIFLRLHVCATTSVAVFWLFRALNCITRCVGLDHEADRRRQRVFATASVRDVFVSRARIVQKDTLPGVVQWLFRAMQNLTAFSSAVDQDGLFAKVRDDVFLPLAPRRQSRPPPSSTP